MAALIQRVTSDGTVYGFEWHDVLVIYPVKQQTVHGQRETNGWMASLMREHRAGVGAVVWIRTNIPPPDEAVRKEISEALRIHARDFHAIAHVLEGTGFRRAMLRGIMIGVNVLTVPCPSTVAGTFAEAAGWLFGNLPANPARGTLPELVSTVDGAIKGLPAA